MNHIIGFHPTAKFKKSFSLKLMAILLACMSVVIIFTSIIYYQSSSRLIQREYVRSTQQLLKEVSQNLERYYTQLDNVTRSLYNDDDFIDNLRFKRNDYASVLYNESIVKSLLYADDAIEYIRLYTPFDQQLYTFSRLMINQTTCTDYKAENWYNETINAKHFFTLSPLHPFQVYSANGATATEKLVITTNRALRYYVTGDIIGMLSISYSPSYMDSICENVYSEEGYTVILDHDLNFIQNKYDGYTLDTKVKNILSKSPTKDSFQYDSSDGARLVLWAPTEHFYLVKDIPLNFLTKSTRSVLWLMLTFSSLIFLLAVLIAFYLSRSATRRLNHLAAQVSEFGKETMYISDENYGSDEIGTLAATFHDMAARINELISLEYKAKVLKQSAELQALQAQVNPHFINNALQVIGTYGLKSNAPEVYKMTSSLAKMLHYTLKPTTHLVPLKQEINNMNDYLYIQQILWSNRLHVESVISPGVESFLVPVFILQPLIENSIRHGLDGLDKGTIKIGIQLQNKMLSISLSDNGRGIPPASLSILREWLTEDTITFDFENHIGIRNIVGRIRLLYGASASFDISCPAAGGTHIQILLPQKEKMIYESSHH